MVHHHTTLKLLPSLYRKRIGTLAKAIYVVGNEQFAHFKQLAVL